MTRYTVQPFDPLTATRAEWAAFHAFRRARAEEDDPGEPVEADAECEYGLTFHWPLYENRRWLAWADGAIIGSIRSGFRRLGTQDYETHAPYVGAGGRFTLSCSSARKRSRRFGRACPRVMHSWKRSVP